MSRTPVPTPRRGDRTRRAPVRYGFEDDDDQRDITGAETMSVCSSASTSSRASTRRSAELRLKQLQEEEELKRKHEETVRALELLRARHEVERAALEEDNEVEERQRVMSERPASRTNLEPQPSTINDSRHERTCRTEAVDMTQPFNITINEAPRLDILTFDGDVAHYPLFKRQIDEAMKSAVFSEAKIVSHLKDRLKGEAFRAVHGALLAGASLARILHVLDTRFGNKLQVTRTVVSRLLQRPNLRASDTEELARYSTEIYNALAILESMGLEKELNNLRTMGVLIEKLPLDSQHAWGSYGRQRAGDDGDVTCRILCDFLEEHAKDRLFGAPSVRERSQEQSNRKPRPLPRSVKTSHSMGVSVDSHQPAPSERSGKRNESQRAPISCYFCKQSHWISRCKAFEELTCDERWKWTSRSSACVRCLSTSHRTQQCHRQLPCGVAGCAENHHALLHKVSPGAEVVGTIQPNQKIMLMKTVVMEIHGPRATRRCVAYLDEGSSITMIEQQLAEELGLSMKPETMKIRTMTGVTEHEVGRLDLLVSSVATGDSFTLKDTVAVEKLQLAKNPVPVKDLAEKYPQLGSMAIPHLDEAPRMLIGIDNAELIATRQLRRTTKNGPLLQKTLIGWTVTGRALADITVTDGDEQVRFIRPHVNEDASMNELMQSSWTTESFGCTYGKDMPHSPEDRRAEVDLREQVYHDGARWVAPILLREEQTAFPPSRPMAENRTRALERKLDKSEHSDAEGNLAELVYEKMDEMVKNGHFRKLSAEEAATETDRTWYLPLLAVTNKTKPGKVRLVLDAAAKSRGRCLNDYLMRGPDFTNSIPGIICRWREKPVAVTSDVKSMFSQILVQERDRASLRFLWRGRRRTGSMDTYESRVVIFGAKSSPAIAGYCFRETGNRFGSTLPHVLDAIENGTYVDDIIYSVDTEAEAVRLIGDLTSTLARGGFELSDWTSNSASVMKAVSREQSSCDEGVALDVSDSHRALGIVWKPNGDVITYRAQLTTPGPTKRSILSVVMSVFDPLGYLSGWLLPVKKTLQNMWAQNRGWEDEPDRQGQTVWEGWTRELALISSVTLPRHLFHQEAGVRTVEVHAFCDASMDGFCAVVYYRWSYRSEVSVAYVAARCRLSPLKSLSVPRLELQAAVLAARLISSLRKESGLNWSSVTYWSDSRNVLAWIKAQDRRYHVFVSNRTAEILDASSPDQWRYVPTALNPADGGSRGHRLEDLRSDGVWASGPDFLRQPSSQWPEALSESPQEILRDDPETKVVFAVHSSQSLVPDLRQSLPDMTRFSRWNTAIRTVCLILRWKNRARKDHAAQPDSKTDALLELEAETLLMKLAQQEAYAAESRDLKAGVPVDRKSPLSSLTVVWMNGLICLDSRTRRSPEMSTSARFPVIMPRGHPCTQLLIQHIHEKMAHRAQDAVLVELRQRCWVPQAAREIRKVVSRCQACKNRKAKPAAPPMAPLPLPRVTMLDGAFRATGLDFFGPMQIKKGRAVSKIWGALFRCMATKAVHIELTERLDTDATLMVIARFQARRGNVKEIWTDNARGFVSASKELRQQFARLNQEKISERLGLDGITWRFNPPADPEAGGVWERNIRTVKETLRIILKERQPTYEVLSTLLCEVEKILNSTPLFHVPVDPDDEEPLTPFHFLIGRPTPSYPRGTQSERGRDLRKRWQHAQTLSDHFWRRWVREYLPTLARRVKWNKTDRDIAVGDVVIIVDPLSPRGLWPRGVVEEVLRAEDGHVRSALVKTKHGVLHRPARKLIVLDLIPAARR